MKYIGMILWTVLATSVGCSLAHDKGNTPEDGPLKFCRFRAGDTVSYGLVEGDRVRQLDGSPFGKFGRTHRTWALEDVKLLVPVRPTKVLALAGNYGTHLGDTPKHPHPEIFFKLPSALISHDADVEIPPGTTDVHPEAEMVLVIGRRARNVPESEALDYLFGVTCGNDVSARDWQKNDVQWWRAKGSDTFGPCGPFIVCGLDQDDLLLQLRCNGEVKQSQRTRDLIHNVAQIISFISRHVTLEAGDLIYTGTPGATSPIKPGDLLEVELEGVGILRNRVKAKQIPNEKKE